ncbi:hypothetical protein B0J11DRAFT_42090 [Dendryphion nanum]|uniref:Galactose oxidase n=1 Tax=Dendryphion nanum TaxID=256645 RepID=A0A9P9J2Y1_9PLEO|nr:hypothetical protein B0J11DRAFT_42090 [Dendryphion nanum]
MEPAIAGALYTAENLISGAVALAAGILHPTLPLKANLTHLTSVPLPRTNHTISIIKGRAYIFGGEESPGTLAPNDMNIVILPSSGVLSADYTSIPARSIHVNGSVPAPRRGHSAAVIGDLIYIFGGEGVAAAENGRIWVFNTSTNDWSFMDPSPGSAYPSPRSGHASTSAAFPGPRDVIYKERAPQQPADPAKAVPEPADEDSWGTVFLLGGRDIGMGSLLNDALAFDVRTRTWSNIPVPPGQPREGASVTIVGDRMYRFGGKRVGSGISSAAQMQYLDVSPVWKHAEGGTTPLAAGWAWEDIGLNDEKDERGEAEAVPNSRAGAGLVNVTTGQGRNYLLAIGGEAQAGFETETVGTSSARFLDDIWAFQIPASSTSAAALKDQTRAAIKRDTNEGKWAEVLYTYVDAKGEEEKEDRGTERFEELGRRRGVGARGHFAVAKGTEVDGASVVVWGGVDGQGGVLGDGWLVTVER